MKMPMWSNDKKLQYSYVLLCFINFSIIVFVSGVIYITTIRINNMYQARVFLSSVAIIPDIPAHIILLSFLSFPALLIVMRIRHSMEKTGWTLFCFFLLELFLCILNMKALNFSTNSILLLVIADLLTYIKSNQERALFMFAIIILYLLANYDFLSAKFSMVSFYNYIECYNSITKSILLSIHNTLISANIIVFIIYLIFLVQDKINESKHFIVMNDQLSKLNNQLKEYANIREKMGETRERNRLAREIHDTLGHTLTGLSVGIDACIVMSEINPKVTKEQLAVLSESARQGLKDVRRSVDKLRPDALEHYTLKEALDKMIHDFVKLTDVQIHFVCHLPVLVFSKDEEEVIYRIIQEGMTNAVRHGEAKEIFISIAKENHTLILIIEDDGKGCSNIKPDFGLHHMKERIELLQGNIRFYGSNGFVILAELPIREGN